MDAAAPTPAGPSLGSRLGGGLIIVLMFLGSLALWIAIPLGWFWLAGKLSTQYQSIYLLVMFTLARPLFSDHPLRRLGYLAWAFIGIAPAVPGLWDRTIWMPLSPGTMCSHSESAAPHSP